MAAWGYYKCREPVKINNKCENCGAVTRVRDVNPEHPVHGEKEPAPKEKKSPEGKKKIAKAKKTSNTQQRRKENEEMSDDGEDSEQTPFTHTQKSKSNSMLLVSDV
ncbi:hypothetical protein N7466_010217 [Penicillium verhagenii]|uniref:uncharacterized protein n=1 Tax=Penicillium verhagenii TaxID=1562060 RepID=UPI0025451C6C|nr:uncharacterized protein N7466_010217 [Penicillium verhagenii]KAJ5919274.1 hypothetical protein N7466_010217 [Penicillium verhagenii]